MAAPGDLLRDPLLRVAVDYVLPPAPEWQRKALCAGDSIDIYVPEYASPKTIKEAKRVCSMCPVRAECLAWAIDNDEYGVWGATTRQERRDIVRARAMPAHTTEEKITVSVQSDHTRVAA